MKKEFLHQCLQNSALMDAVRQKDAINNTKKALWQARETLEETGVDSNVLDIVKRKCDEYVKISQGYGELIESVWGITWQSESIILRYMDCSDIEFERLPDSVNL